MKGTRRATLRRAAALLGAWLSIGAETRSAQAQPPGAGSPVAAPASGAPPGSPAQTPPPAATYKFQPGVSCPLCTITPQYPHGRSGLHWHQHWRSVGWREYATVAGLSA